MKQALTPKQSAFARHLFEGKSQPEAYKASYDADGMTPASIAAEAKKLAANPAVVAAVENMRETADYVASLNVAWVLKQYMQIATADVNELVESRRLCCRHCHGIGHAYQWVDDEEFALELARILDLNARNESSRKPLPPLELPNFDGGVGFWATKEPHADCPKCFGVGRMEVHVHDTRKLKGAAKLLYAGIKQTANGVEIKTRDQDAALAFLAKYLGLDKQVVEHTGKGGGPIQSISTLTNDPAEAAKAYAAIMGG